MKVMLSVFATCASQARKQARQREPCKKDRQARTSMPAKVNRSTIYTETITFSETGKAAMKEALRAYQIGWSRGERAGALQQRRKHAALQLRSRVESGT